MLESLVSDEGDDAGEFPLGVPSADTVGAAGSVPVRCLLGVDPYLSRPVHQAVLDMADRWMVCEVGDGLDAVYVAGSTVFDLVVLDQWLPVVDGYSAAVRICSGGAGGRGTSASAVILVVDSVHELPVSPSIPGAQLRVLFRDSPTELIRSTMSWAAGMAEGQEPLPPRHVEPLGEEPAGWAASRSPDQSWTGLLSARERQVLVSLCLGQSNRQLASALSVSEATVKTHVSHLLNKLGLASRVEAVVFAYENGIVVPGRRRRTA